MEIQLWGRVGGDALGGWPKESPWEIKLPEVARRGALRNSLVGNGLYRRTINENHFWGIPNMSGLEDSAVGNGKKRHAKMAD